MRINGEAFLRVTHARSIRISYHALRRISECIGRGVSEDMALGFLFRGQHVRADEMFLLGYRPAYTARVRRGQESWYFRFEVNGDELVAVLTRGDEEREYVWVTTYSRDSEAERRRTASFSQLSLAAALN